jgi:hypothetical protein
MCGEMREFVWVREHAASGEKQEEREGMEKNLQ